MGKGCHKVVEIAIAIRKINRVVDQRIHPDDYVLEVRSKSICLTDEAACILEDAKEHIASIFFVI